MKKGTVLIFNNHFPRSIFVEPFVPAQIWHNPARPVMHQKIERHMAVMVLDPPKDIDNQSYKECHIQLADGTRGYIWYNHLEWLHASATFGCTDAECIRERLCNFKDTSRSQ